jgi:NAD(P) transhydrogenase
MTERYDFVVIGAGPAGEKAATQAAYFGKSVAVVEQETPGGAVVRNAGVPNKTLRETALYLSGFRKRDIYGLSLQLSPEATLERLMGRTTQVIQTRLDAVSQNLDRHGIRLTRGRASLNEDGTVVVSEDGQTTHLRGEVVLIATGSRPLRPRAVPFDDPDVHDSESILTMDRLPGSLAVIGGGPVGCEYASIFAALGVEVAIIDLAPRLASFLDAEISEGLAAVFQGMGMRLFLGSTGPASIERRDGRLQVGVPDGETLAFEKVLFAAGRSGNTEGLGLEAVGVAVDDRGRIVVDETFQTSVPGIYAAGDVIGPPALASASMEQGRVAACHAFDIPFKLTVDPLPPMAIYSIPEAAGTGMTEEAAAGAGIDYEVGRGYFVNNTRANISGWTDGLVKLVFRADDRKLLGVHILGEIAGELIHVGQAALHAEADIDRFIHTTYNVPTYTEEYKYAAYNGLQRLSARE